MDALCTCMMQPAKVKETPQRLYCFQGFWAKPSEAFKSVFLLSWVDFNLK